MLNFNKKVKHLSNLYAYKFKEYDYDKFKYKIYFISVDDQYLYMSIDGLINENGKYLCEIGTLFMDNRKMKLFEDTPDEVIFLDNGQFKMIKKFIDKTPLWSNSKIKDIIEATDKMDKDLAI